MADAREIHVHKWGRQSSNGRLLYMCADPYCGHVIDFRQARDAYDDFKEEFRKEAVAILSAPIVDKPGVPGFVGDVFQKLRFW